MRPAGFLQRCAAWTLDAAVLAPAALAIAWPRLHAAGATWGQGLGRVGERLGEAALAGMPPRDLPALLLRDPVLAETVAALHGASAAAALPAVAAFAVLGAFWNVLGERSRWQGSAGKRLLGLRVTDRAGRPPSLPRSLSRHLAGAASWLTLNLGHALAALPPRRLALHDRFAGTRVVAASGAPLPGWARLWLAAVAAAGLAATAWLALAASRAMQAGLDRALY